MTRKRTKKSDTSVQEEKPSLKFEAKTLGQRQYLKMLHAKDFVVCSGPPGSGKTFLACAVGAKMLKEGVVRSILITRPLVETGRELGALPGDVAEKINPYMMPVMENLKKSGMSHSEIQTLKNSNAIRVLPLELLRGMTFDNCYMILDEAQNATHEQIKMFLTRIGENSRLVITGDPEQSDLHYDCRGAFAKMYNCLETLPEVGTLSLNDCDVVRHSVIAKILDALKKNNYR